jgi:hypothetical protein
MSAALTDGSVNAAFDFATYFVTATITVMAGTLLLSAKSLALSWAMKSDPDTAPANVVTACSAVESVSTVGVRSHSADVNTPREQLDVPAVLESW